MEATVPSRFYIAGLIRVLGTVVLGASYASGQPVITLGQTVNGTLLGTAPSGNCLFNTPTERWQFTLASSTVATIDLSSSVFDTYVCVLNASNLVLASDDNSGSASDSRLLYLTQIPVVDITINRGRAASFSRSEPSEETAAASHTGTQEAAEPRCDAPTARTTMELAIECVDSTLPESSPASSRLARAQSEKNMGGFGGIT